MFKLYLNKFKLINYQLLISINFFNQQNESNQTSHVWRAVCRRHDVYGLRSGRQYERSPSAIDRGQIDCAGDSGG